MHKFQFLASINFSSQWCLFKINRLLTRIEKNKFMWVIPERQSEEISSYVYTDHKSDFNIHGISSTDHCMWHYRPPTLVGSFCVSLFLSLSSLFSFILMASLTWFWSTPNLAITASVKEGKCSYIWSMTSINTAVPGLGPCIVLFKVMGVS